MLNEQAVGPNSSNKRKKEDEETEIINNTHVNQSDKDALESGKKEEVDKYFDFDQFCEKVLRELEVLEKETLLGDGFGGRNMHESDFVTLRLEEITPLEETLNKIRPGWKLSVDICQIIFLACMISVILANLLRNGYISGYHVERVYTDQYYFS